MEFLINAFIFYLIIARFFMKFVLNMLKLALVIKSGIVSLHL